MNWITSTVGDTGAMTVEELSQGSTDERVGLLISNRAHERIIVFTLIVQLIASSALGQKASVPFEVELLMNPNAGRKDTREVNAVLVFEADGIRVQSRRSREVFKKFSYSDIRSAEHAFRRRSLYRMSGTAIALAVLSGMPIFLLAAREKEKHFLIVATVMTMRC
jgi:hypothetical protein